MLDVDEMLENMDLEQWAEWIFFYRMLANPPKPESDWRQQKMAMMMHGEIVKGQKRGRH